MDQSNKRGLQSWLWMLLLLAAVIVIAAVVILAAKPEPCGDCVVDGDDLEDQIVRPGFPNADAIPVHHVFAENIHTITGTLSLPDPCYDIVTDVRVMESFPEQVVIDIETPRRDEMCATVITDKTFEITFQASEQARISAMLNGERVDLLGL